MNRSAFALAGVAAWAGAAALGPTPARAADPTVTLPAPRLAYTSAFAGVPGHSDAAPIEWARSNALVGELKGHAGHLRGSAAPAPNALPAQAPAGHGAHAAPSSPERRP